MNAHKATVYVTKLGRFVGYGTNSAQLWFPLSDDIYEQIEAMLEQDKVVLDSLSMRDPELYREVRLKHISHTPLSIFMRSEEDLTMMCYYLQCQTSCASKAWPLRRVEEFTCYHLR